MCPREQRKALKGPELGRQSMFSCDQQDRNSEFVTVPELSQGRLPQVVKADPGVSFYKAHKCRHSEKITTTLGGRECIIVTELS